MKRPIAIATALLALSFAYTRSTASAQDDRPLDPKVVAWDKGPDRIDISRYPAEMKEDYKVFVRLCSNCHTLARAVNCDFVLEDDWERYIKKMMRRGRSIIKPEDAEKIFAFATYDAKARKRELYDQRVKLAGGR
jgi:hypothetical protein